MCPKYYEINVSRNGTHFFATAERSCTTESRTKIIYRRLKKAFPESDGYKVEVTACVEYEEVVNTEKWETLPES